MKRVPNDPRRQRARPQPTTYTVPESPYVILPHLEHLFPELRSIQTSIATNVILDALVSTYRIYSRPCKPKNAADATEIEMRRVYGWLRSPRRFLWHAIGTLCEAEGIHEVDRRSPAAYIQFDETIFPVPPVDDLGWLSEQSCPAVFPSKTVIIADDGLLFRVIKAAHKISLIFDCCFERAVEVAMTGIDWRGGDYGQISRPDALTQRAVEHVFVSNRIPPHPRIILDRFPQLDWAKTRSDLKTLVGPIVRKRARSTMTLELGQEAQNKDFPRFCWSEQECRTRITAAAIAYGRGWIDIGPELQGVATKGGVGWFHYFQRNHPEISIEVFGKVLDGPFIDPFEKDGEQVLPWFPSKFAKEHLRRA